MSFAATIAKLERVKASLKRPVSFYAGHLAELRERARRIATAILQSNRPPDTDPEEWARRVEAESARIAATFFAAEDEIGVILSMGLRPPDVRATDPKYADVDGIRIDEIERWVEAGRGKTDPEAPGKNFDERDAGKSDLQIAWRLLYAVKLRRDNWEHLLAHITEFLGADSAAPAAALYDDILRAWLEQLGPEIRAAWREWTHQQIRTALR